MSVLDAKKAMISAIREVKKPLLFKIRNEDGDPDKAIYDPQDDKIYYEPYLSEVEAMSLENATFLILGGLLENSVHDEDDEDFGEDAADALERMKDRF